MALRLCRTAITQASRRNMAQNSRFLSTADTQTGHKDVTTNISSEHNKNIIWSDALLTKEQRQELLGAKHKGATLWVTGLSGSGKSTVGAAFEAMLLEKGIHSYRLDGDNVRFGLNAGLGFSEEDRDENLRRTSEVSALFTDAGLITITTFISPYQKNRDKAREIHEKKGLSFFEVYAEVPLEVAESRDPKGLYKKARTGEIKNFTGISDPYEAPVKPDITIPTHELSVEQSCQRLFEYLQEVGVISKDF
eukprot:maker-scaffold_5-snap-gene-3.43-mRNA-1 protein AED:0.01 eAED:0.01 QI:399/1/1/1/1/1/2/105/249